MPPADLLANPIACSGSRTTPGAEAPGASEFLALFASDQRNGGEY